MEGRVAGAMAGEELGHTYVAAGGWFRVDVGGHKVVGGVLTPFVGDGGLAGVTIVRVKAAVLWGSRGVGVKGCEAVFIGRIRNWRST